MTDQQQIGGAEWERNEAADQIGDALARGDAEAVRIGANRLGDALVNGTAARLIPTLQNVLESVLKRELGEVVKRMDRSDHISLDWRTEMRLHIDARFDAYGLELDGTRGDVAALRSEVSASNTSFQSTIEQLRADLADMKEGVTDVREGALRRFGLLDQLSEQVATLTADLAAERAARLALANQTIASELTADERRELTEANRWLLANKDRIVLRDT